MAGTGPGSGSDTGRLLPDLATESAALVVGGAPIGRRRFAFRLHTLAPTCTVQSLERDGQFVKEQMS